jgi:hypothetical protein
MADEQQVLAAAKELPLREQLAHTSWRVRDQALATIQERIQRAGSCEDEIFEETGGRGAGDGMVRPSRSAARGRAARQCAHPPLLCRRPLPPGLQPRCSARRWAPPMPT